MDLNSTINDEMKVNQKYKSMCNSRIRDIQDKIMNQKLPALDKQRMEHEQALMTDIK